MHTLKFGNLLLVFVLLAQTAHAQQEDSQANPQDQEAPSLEAERADTQARIHFQSGNEYFEVADFEAALREFERAFELSHRAQLLYNLYLTHERLGHLEQASIFLGRYLIEARDVEGRSVLEQRLRTMRRRLEAQRPATPADATQSSSQAGANEHPSDAAGHPSDAAGHPSDATEHQADAAESEPRPDPSVSAETDAGDADEAHISSALNPPRARRSRSGVAITFWSLGAASLVSFGVSAWLARSANDDASHYCGVDVGRQCVGDEPVLDRLRRRARSADISLGAAGAFMVTGLVLTLLHRERATVTVGASADSGSAQLGVVGSF